MSERGAHAPDISCFHRAGYDDGRFGRLRWGEPETGSAERRRVFDFHRSVCFGLDVNQRFFSVFVSVSFGQNIRADDLSLPAEAILLGVSDPSSPLIAHYTISNGMNSMVAWINEYKKGNYGVTGTKRYYDIRVLETSTAAGGQGAKITYCEDESKFFGTDKATGKTLTTSVTLKDYSRVTVSVTKNLKTGTWMDGYYIQTQGDQQCRTLAG